MNLIGSTNKVWESGNKSMTEFYLMEWGVMAIRHWYRAENNHLFDVNVKRFRICKKRHTLESNMQAALNYFANSCGDVSANDLMNNFMTEEEKLLKEQLCM